MLKSKTPVTDRPLPGFQEMQKKQYFQKKTPKTELQIRGGKKKAPKTELQICGEKKTTPKNRTPNITNRDRYRVSLNFFPQPGVGLRPPGDPGLAPRVKNHRIFEKAPKTEPQNL